MELKDYLMYLVSVPVALYSLYEAWAVYDGVSTLYTSNPECFKKSANREYAFFGTLLVFCVTAMPLEHSFVRYFNLSLPEDKFPLGSKERTVKALIMAERSFRVIVYTIFTGAAWWIMSKGNYLTILLGGNTWEPRYYIDYPCQPLPPYQDEFYLVKFAYHFYELMHLSIFLRKRRDFPEMLLHHLMSVVMITYSYATALLPIGAAIMIIMDCSNIFMSLFKAVEIYPARLPIFVINLFVWLYMRVLVYPTFIYELYEQAGATGHPV